MNVFRQASGALIPALIMMLLTVSCNQAEKQQEAVKGDFSGELTEKEKAGGVLTPEIMWKFGRVGEQVLSPDGSAVLFTVTRYDHQTNGRITDIYSVETGGGEMVRLTGADGSCFNPRWTPGGKKIGFVSTESGSAQLWEMNTDGSGAVRISDIDGGISGFEYAPGGDRILYIKDVKCRTTTEEVYPDLPKANVRIIDELMYRHWDHWEDAYCSHIFVAERNGGGLTNHVDIMEGEPYDAPMSPWFDQGEITWTPDGKAVAYVCKKMDPNEYAVSTNSDIYLYEVEQGTTTNMTEGMPGYDKYPRFSPDGSMMAWQSMATPGYEADKERLFVMDLESGEKRYLTEGWDQNAANMLWDEDGKTIWFISGIKATYQVYRIDVESREITQVTEGVHNYTSLAKAGDVITGTKMSMSMASEVFAVDPASGGETQLSFVNKHIYDHIEMGEVKARWVETTDGKQMKVWVIYPPGFDESQEYPGLLYCQGGPQSAVSQFFSFRWNFQMMAANGYVVVAPNRRGLPSFGQEWNDQITGDYGGQNIRDYLSAIDAVKKEPYVDQERLGAIGASYGGYSVFYLAGNHDGRFKAFISHCGIFNMESMYAETEETFFVHHDNEGAFWEDPKPVNYSYSPHRYVDRWDTPILIITGEYDFRIPYTQSMQAFNAAQLRGVPSRLLIFPEETHFVLKPQNAILWQREFRDWLDTYLKE